ncbi:hypothetical protein HK105_207001 [Polyrhizophydium stewartii]|uniref:Uncharacterized protein n=1 Tax=Polyrhizophydium stewartii TaxID=2732419 RepID=A0ABR4N1Z3_9FUNG
MALAVGVAAGAVVVGDTATSDVDVHVADDALHAVDVLHVVELNEALVLALVSVAAALVTVAAPADVAIAELSSAALGTPTDTPNVPGPSAVDGPRGGGRHLTPSDVETIIMGVIGFAAMVALLLHLALRERGKTLRGRRVPSRQTIVAVAALPPHMRPSAAAAAVGGAGSALATLLPPPPPPYRAQPDQPPAGCGAPPPSPLDDPAQPAPHTHSHSHLHTPAPTHDSPQPDADDDVDVAAVLRDTASPEVSIPVLDFSPPAYDTLSRLL